MRRQPGKDWRSRKEAPYPDPAMRRGVETSGAEDSSRAAIRDDLLSGSMLNRPLHVSIATPVRAPRCPTGWPWAESEMMSLRAFACHSFSKQQSFRRGLSARMARSACPLAMTVTTPEARNTVMSPLPPQPLSTARCAAASAVCCRAEGRDLWKELLSKSPDA